MFRKNVHLHEYSRSSDKLTIIGQVKCYAYKFYKSRISSPCYLVWNCKIVKVNYATKTCNLKRPTCHNIRYSSWNCETVKLVFLQFLFSAYVITTVRETKRRRIVETIDFSKVSETLEAKNEARTFPELFRRDLFAVDVHLCTPLPLSLPLNSIDTIFPAFYGTFTFPTAIFRKWSTDFTYNRLFARTS